MLQAGWPGAFFLSPKMKYYPKSTVCVGKCCIGVIMFHYIAHLPNFGIKLGFKQVESLALVVNYALKIGVFDILEENPDSPPAICSPSPGYILKIF